MVDQDLVWEVIVSAIGDVNPTLSADAKIEPRSDFVLLGANGSLDSLALVNFILSVENSFSEKTGQTITILDEQHIAGEDSPYSTLHSLAAHIKVLANS